MDDELESARTTIAQLQSALNSRVAIEQAKGALSVMAGVDVNAAFRALKKYSRDHNRTLQSVSRDVVSGALTDYQELIVLARAASVRAKVADQAVPPESRKVRRVGF